MEDKIIVDVAILKERVDEFGKFRDEMKKISRDLSDASTVLEKAISNQVHQYDQQKNILTEIQKNSVQRQRDYDAGLKEIRSHMTDMTNDMTNRDEILFSKITKEIEEVKHLNAKAIEIINKSISESIENTEEIFDEIKKDVTVLKDRVNALEQWRWYLIGIGAAIIFAVTQVPWDLVFPN